MRRLFASLLGALVLGSPLSAYAQEPVQDPVQHPAYVLRVSPTAGPHTLLLALHGWRLSSDWMETTTGLDAGLVRGYDLAYLNGVGASWNAGRCCGDAVTLGVDEETYVEQVISEVRTVDPSISRVVAAGFSNGGMLAWRLACDRIVAAAVVVAGALVSPCAHAVDVLHIHGRRDGTVPVRGGYSAYTGVTFPNDVRPVLPAGSRYSLVLWDGAHSWPAFATSLALRWLTPAPAHTLGWYLRHWRHL